MGEDELLTSFLAQHYTKVGTPPRLIILPFVISEGKLLEEWLTERRGRRVRLLIPRRGTKLDLVTMTQENARLYLEQEQAKASEEQQNAREALFELAEVLGLSEPPRRLECYDISTLQGEDSVGSMVVFTEGLPDKEQYRRFKIRYDPGAPDDYAMMREMLERRLGAALLKSRKFAALPDLLVIDGGKGSYTSPCRPCTSWSCRCRSSGWPNVMRRSSVPVRNTVRCCRATRVRCTCCNASATKHTASR